MARGKTGRFRRGSRRGSFPYGQEYPGKRKFQDKSFRELVKENYRNPANWARGAVIAMGIGIGVRSNILSAGGKAGSALAWVL